MSSNIMMFVTVAPASLLPTYGSRWIYSASQKNYLKRTMPRRAKILFSSKTFYRVIQMGIRVAPLQIYYSIADFPFHTFSQKKIYIFVVSHDLNIQTVQSRDPPLTDHFLPKKCLRCRQRSQSIQALCDHARALARISQDFPCRMAHLKFRHLRRSQYKHSVVCEWTVAFIHKRKKVFGQAQ